MEEKKMNSQQIEGRNAVMEAFRSGKPIDKVYILDGCQDGPIRSIVREAKKHDTILNFVTKERLNQISETGRHQGVIAQAAAYEYAQVEDMLELAKQKGALSGQLPQHLPAVKLFTIYVMNNLNGILILKICETRLQIRQKLSLSSTLTILQVPSTLKKFLNRLLNLQENISL